MTHIKEEPMTDAELEEILMEIEWIERMMEEEEERKYWDR